MASQVKPIERSSRETRTPREEAVRAHIGRKIAAARTERGITAGALAAQVGLSVDRLSRFEKGRRQLPVRMLCEIAGVLGKPVAYFFNDLPGELPAADDASLHGARDQSHRESRELVEAFDNLVDPKTRREVLRLVRDIADSFRKH